MKAAAVFEYRVTPRDVVLIVLLLVFSLLMATLSGSLAWRVLILGKSHAPAVSVLAILFLGIALYLLRYLFITWKGSFSIKQVVLDVKEGRLGLVLGSRELVFQLPEAVDRIYRDREQYEIRLSQGGKQYFVNSRNLREREDFENALEKALPDFPSPEHDKYGDWQRKR